MPGGKHLHIGESDAIAGWLGSALASAKSGAITIGFAGEPAVEITADAGSIAVNLLQPSIFRVPEDETGLFDKLNTASEFGRRLSDSGVTLSFSRRGREAVKLGKGARPTLSKLVSGSDDIQISNMTELARLKGDLG